MVAETRHNCYGFTSTDTSHYRDPPQLVWISVYIGTTRCRDPCVDLITGGRIEGFSGFEVLRRSSNPTVAFIQLLTYMYVHVYNSRIMLALFSCFSCLLRFLSPALLVSFRFLVLFTAVPYRSPDLRLLLGIVPLKRGISPLSVASWLGPVSESCISLLFCSFAPFPSLSTRVLESLCLIRRRSIDLFKS